MRADPALSWGRYPFIPQTVQPVRWRNELRSAMAGVTATTLARGNGRSYGDSCLAASDVVLGLSGLDRFITFDRLAGIVRAEAGLTLEALNAITLPAGWFIPVTPGTAQVTLGGAVANDVHGKNHHRRGTFGCHVRQLGLQRSDSGPLTCSSEAEVELFAATIGGLGLTGVIEWVEAQLMPVGSTEIDTVTERFDSLDRFFALSEALDARHEYSVSWVDVLADGAQRGRGVFTAGDHVTPQRGKSGQTTGSDHDGRVASPQRPAAAPSRAPFAPDVPFCPPVSPVRSWSVRAFNAAVFHRAPVQATRRRIDYRRFFYPLDRVGHWNRLYGPAGFQQFQCVVPNREARDSIAALLEAIANSGKGSFLAVLKRCGPRASPGWLSFPMAGVSLALDFAQQPALDAALLPRLDAIVAEAGGRLYPAKDAHMSARHFQQAYPAWERLEAMRDPVLMSRFWQRVTKPLPARTVSAPIRS